MQGRLGNINHNLNRFTVLLLYMVLTSYRGTPCYLGLRPCLTPLVNSWPENYTARSYFFLLQNVGNVHSFASP